MGVRSLFVGGSFDTAGGVPVKALARWGGQTWSALGTGLTGFTIPQVGPTVYALEVYDDDGAGPRTPGLYAGGAINAAGGVTVNNVARWDGVAWEALGQGVNDNVYSLAVYDDDGPGPNRPALYAGGSFDVIGVPGPKYVARWDGTSWSGLPEPVWGLVQTMAVFDDDGPGPNKPSLFVGGAFFVVGTQFANHIARFDGTHWYPMGSGVTGFGAGTGAHALAVYDEDGPGPNPGGLYVGGYFYYAGGVESHHVARWGCPLPPRCDANCNKDFHPVTGAHILTVADFGCFQTRYVLSDPFADCNEDGALTVADFGCFQTKFVAGCP